LQSVVGYAIACQQPSVDIVGHTPLIRPRIADALCDRGQMRLIRSPPTVCEGTIERATYEACFAEAEPDIRADLEQCALTAAEERQLQDCINARLEESCISQSELDAYVAKLNAGDPDADIRPPLPECVGIGALFEGC
jgi:hypothetical protein